MQDESGCCYLHCISSLMWGVAWACWEERSLLTVGACPQPLHLPALWGGRRGGSRGCGDGFHVLSRALGMAAGRGSWQPFHSVAGLIPKQHQTSLPGAGNKTRMKVKKKNKKKNALGLEASSQGCRTVRSRVTSRPSAVCHGGLFALAPSENQHQVERRQEKLEFPLACPV